MADKSVDDMEKGKAVTVEEEPGDPEEAQESTEVKNDKHKVELQKPFEQSEDPNEVTPAAIYARIKETTRLIQEDADTKRWSPQTYEELEGVVNDAFASALTDDRIQQIDSLHFKNVVHTRSKLLSNSIMLQADNKDWEDALTRLDQVQTDLANYSMACHNLLAWKSLGITERLVLSATDYSPELAMIEGGEKTNLLSAEKRKDIFYELYKKLLDPRSADEASILGYMSRANAAQDRNEEQNKFFERLYMALFGGLALIAPMLIMTLHPGKTTSLTTTSVFVVAVAVALAYYMKAADSKDIVGATAAYAAVLVVFVGTGTTTTG